MADAVAMTEELTRRMLRVVTYVERLMGTHDLGNDLASAVEPLWFKTSSATADNQGHYPGVPTLFSAPDNAWVEYETAKLAAPNGEALSNATRYPVRPVGRRASDNAELFMTLEHPSSGGSLTVKEVDGTPTYTGITEMRFDSIDGYSLSQPAAGVVRIDHLSADSVGQNGIVDQADQNWTGIKHFKQGLIADDNAFTNKILAGHQIAIKILAGSGTNVCGFRIPTNSTYQDGVDWSQVLTANSSTTGSGVMLRSGDIYFLKWNSSDQPRDPVIKTFDSSGTVCTGSTTPFIMGLGFQSGLAGGTNGRASAPSNSSSTGTEGEIFKDNSFFYVCIATNTWKRVAIATW